MVFIVKVAYNMEMVKIAKLTKIYGGNLKSRKRLATALHLTHKIYSRLLLSNWASVEKKALANIMENSRKTSTSSSTVHETALPKHDRLCG